MWSLGVIVFSLLSGHMPFLGKTKGQGHCLKLIRKGRYRMNADRWEGVSDTAKDFVRRLLVVDTEQRLSVSQALNHFWFQGREEISLLPPVADRTIVNAFVEFSKASRAKQVCMKVMAWTLHADARRKLQDAFIHSSLTNTGVINIDELKLMLGVVSLDSDEGRTWLDLLDALDDEGDGKLRYSDFLAAMMAAEPDVYDESLHQTFWHFAGDDGLTMTPQSMRSVLGDAVTEDEVFCFFDHVDADKDGSIDAHDFVTYLCRGDAQKLVSRVDTEVMRFISSKPRRSFIYAESSFVRRVVSCCLAVRATSLPFIGGCFST